MRVSNEFCRVGELSLLVRDTLSHGSTVRWISRVLSCRSRALQPLDLSRILRSVKRASVSLLLVAVGLEKLLIIAWSWRLHHNVRQSSSF